MNLDLNAAMNARDCLMKMVYNRIFEQLISTLNGTFNFASASKKITLLDIPGFGKC